MTCACPAAELAADTYILKLQRLQNNALRTTGIFPRYIPIRDLNMAFNLPYIYDYITKLCRRQAEVVQNQENEHVRSIGQGEADTENIIGLDLAVVKLTTVQVTKLPL
jgi:hypothetical protein